MNRLAEMPHTSPTSVELVPREVPNFTQQAGGHGGARVRDAQTDEALARDSGADHDVPEAKRITMAL